MAEYEINQLNKSAASYEKDLAIITEEKDKKTAQYIGEGSIFLLLISAGAIFLFRAVKKEFKITHQQQSFMMAITHELKTPIAVSKLNLETLQKRKLDEQQQQRLIYNTLQESNRMNALCNNLLLSSQMDAEAYKLHFEKINLNELLENCIKDFSIRFPGRLESALSNQEVLIEGDAFLLQMAFNNLIDNAIKYSPKETTVSVKMFTSEKNCNLHFTDEGIGISDADKMKVFQKYYRTGSDATKKAKGTGLGLYLVDRIIKSHKGKISIKDNDPKGATFIVSLNKIA
jgi:K+-sensing histidine kinase KdpD